MVEKSMCRMGGATRYPSLFTIKRQRCRVDAKAQSGRIGAVLENMAKMGVALGAADLDAIHAELVFIAVFDHIFVDRLPEAGPTGPRFVFGFRIEQGRAAANATVDADVVAIPVFAGKSRLSAALAANFKLLGRQFFAPFVVGFLVAHLGKPVK